jgi:hypothetical protein
MTDLFGNTVIEQPKKIVRKRKTMFTEYDDFVDKFKRKNTTDECYTPIDVYECVLSYVRDNCDIEGPEVVRPFYPNMDYRDRDYYEHQVVIDNPPFSIISKIARFYVENGVKFFLFAPHLTLFSASIDYTRIICGADVKYENGAVVKTSFVSNLFGDIAVIGDAELYRDLMNIKDVNRPDPLPKYEYPDNVLTVSNLHKIVYRGISMKFRKNELEFISQLDCQKSTGKSLYGNGFLMCDAATIRKAEAETEAEAEAKAKAKAKTKADFVWELSEREKVIVEKLNHQKIK